MGASTPTFASKIGRLRRVPTNGVELDVWDVGHGPTVLLLHGFPECRHSWRHQVPVLVDAGYRVLVPDQRGYAHSSAPQGDVRAYSILQLVADQVGLLDALGIGQAVVVGHDWGAHVASHFAMLRPARVRAIVQLSVPYRTTPWGTPLPTVLFAGVAGPGRRTYLGYFQDEGVAERAFDVDVARVLRAFFVGASGDTPADERLPIVFADDVAFLDACPDYGDRLPGWLTAEDFATYVEAFTASGFHGPIAWYRNYDANHRATAFLRGAFVRQPALYLGGAEDVGAPMVQAAYDALERSMPGLRHKAILPGAGHWLQQEAPDAVNEALLGFLRDL
ncbi:MAG: alpha/beta hydrolase [Acidobacteriota bacterium]